MGNIGLIAGSGVLPGEFVKAAAERGENVVVFAVKDVAPETLEDQAPRVYRLGLDQYAKFAFILIKERIKQIALLGKIKKQEVYKDLSDNDRVEFFAGVKTRADYTLLKAFTEKLAKIGIKVMDPTPYLAHLLPPMGTLTVNTASPAIEADIEFGVSAAKKIAGMDIGQTVIVKERAVVAVEAMEGTDEAIKRGRDVAGDGCVMVKVARPCQDMRWDVPVVGPDTMGKLIENKYSAIAIESGKMYVLEKEKFIRMADAAGVVVKVI